MMTQTISIAGAILGLFIAFATDARSQPLPPRGKQSTRPAPPGPASKPALPKDAMSELATKVAKSVEGVAPGKPRIAVFTFGDERGGRPEKLNPKLTDIEILFHSRLRTALAGKGFVLGADAIRNELHAARGEEFDLANLDPAKPETVAEWLRESFKGGIEVAVIARVGETGTVLTVIGADRRAKPASVTSDIGWGDLAPRLREGDGPSRSAGDQPMIRPALFAVIKNKDGTTARYPIPTFSQKDSNTTLAVIPDEPKELVEALAKQELFLEIVLTHSGSIPKQTFLEQEDPSKPNVFEQYTLAADRTRLFPVSVIVEGRGTIAQEVRDYKFPKDDTKVRNNFVYDEPELQRKWVVAQPGYEVVPDKKDIGEGKRVATGPGHGVISIYGFQQTNDDSSLFRMRKPDVGRAEKMGVSACTGLIRITAFAQKKAGDTGVTLKTTSVDGPVYGKVGIEGGLLVQNKVKALKVPCYRTPIEEHVIQLCTTLQHDPVKEDLQPYPPAITK